MAPNICHHKLPGPKLYDIKFLIGDALCQEFRKY